MPAVSLERLPVQLLGLGVLGFDHLQIVFRHDIRPDARQDDWFVIEGIREQDRLGARLAVEGWDGGTTLSEANGGLVGDELVQKIGTSTSRGAQALAKGGEAVTLWATLVSFAADIEAQGFPYIPVALPSSPLPTINSSSLAASLLHHAGLNIEDALPSGLRFSPGLTTLLGTSGDDTLETAHGFTAIVGGGGNDHLTGSDIAGSVDKLYGGPGNDTFHWSRGVNILHGGQPGLAYEDDGLDTVDYTGAGEIRVDALPGADPHRQPDFVVSHPGGQDYLYSIEEILWDRASDHVKIGRGVGLVTQPPDGDRQGGAGGSARLEMHETLSPSTLAPGDPPGMPWCADGLDDTCDGALPDLGESLGAAFFDAWGSG